MSAAGSLETVVAVLQARQENHEKFCEERARRAEIFETDMKDAVLGMRAAQSEATKRVHDRLDALVRSVAGLLLAVVLSLIGFIGMAIWNKVM